MKSGNLFGRFLALALIVGAVYGVRAIVRGDFGCAGGCCMMGMHHETAGHDQDHEADAKAGAGAVDADGDEDAKLEAKAPIAAPAAKK
jgi:hypothetical protein